MSNSRVNSTAQKLDGIQALRTVAALCVLIFHSFYLSGLVTTPASNSFLRLQLGGFGVYLFFFISGFIMMFQINKTAYEFALHRIFRIYPPYLFALLLGFLIQLPTFGISHFDFHFHVDLLLLPSGYLNPTFGVPYWTLIYEVFFYSVIFLILLLNRSKGLLSMFLLLWAIAIMIGAGFKPLANPVGPDIFKILISPLCIFFVAGSTFGLLYLKKSKIFFGVSALLGIFLIFSSPSKSAFFNGYIHYLIVFVLLFGVALKLYNISKNKFLTKITKIMTRAGDYSYGLYLIHLSIVTAICYSPLFMNLKHWELFMFSFIVAGSSGLIYGYIEHNLYIKKLRPLANSLVEIIKKRKLAASERAELPSL